MTSGGADNDNEVFGAASTDEGRSDDGGGGGGVLERNTSLLVERDKSGEENRERWGNRTEFLFASIGSAIGVGNILRFPILVYRHGGLAFLAPYGASLLLLGIPLLKLETGMGQLLQSGAGLAFAKVHPKVYGVGLTATFCSGIVAWYYSILMAWSAVYLASSFTNPLPWAGGLEAAEDYFSKGVVNMNASLADGFGALQWKLVLGLLASWVSVFFAIFRGTKSMGLVLYVTLPLPFVLLTILLIRGATLPGAGTGVQYYFGRWEWSAFADGTIYVEAVSQIFFSLSLSQGVMQGYASNNESSSPYISNAWIVGLANSCASIFAGFALFSTLGYLSEQSGVSIEDLAEPGFSLAFITYPTALSTFAPGWAQFFSFSFFATLLMLGIDSLFSLVEVIVYLITDINPRAGHKYRWLVALVLCTFFFLISLVFVSRGGYWLVDIVDHYIVSYAVVAVGLLECVVMAFVYGLRRFDKELHKLTGQANSRVWFFCIWIVVPLILAILFVYNFVLEFQGNVPDSIRRQPAWSVGIFGWWFCVATPFLVLLPLGLIVPWKQNLVLLPSPAQMGKSESEMSIGG